MKQLRIAIVLLLVGGVLTTTAFVMAFTTAQVQSFGTVTFAEEIDTAFPVAGTNENGIEYGRPWLSQKNSAFMGPRKTLTQSAIMEATHFAIRFLMTRRREYDTKSRVAMETALVFVTLTMITGVLWTKASWGVWWDWEPRLTTYFIMTLMMVAYFVLRNSVEDEERRAVYAAVFAILTAINAPISFAITRLVPSSHPVVFQPGMDTTNLVPFIIAQVGMLMVGYAIYVMRMSEERLSERLDTAKEALEG